MSEPADLTMVRLTADRRSDVLDLDTWAFPSSHDAAALAELPDPLTWDRTYGMVDAGRADRLVAMHASYPFSRCPVPGGRLPAAGLTWVAVHPEWRRRGVLRTMMAGHFEHRRAASEPISILFAAEPAIYGRFGYGLASKQLSLTMPRRAALREVSGAEGVTVRVETLDVNTHIAVVEELHGAVERPGWVTRETPQLRATSYADPAAFREGFEPARILIAERDGNAVGYALFRRRGGWESSGPTGVVRVREVVAADPAVSRMLWERLLDLDLTTEVTVAHLPVDDPLLNLLVDVRIAQPRWQDNLWLRIIDLPAALAGRRYQADLDVVLEVSDALLPDNAGRWRVRARAFGDARVTRTSDEADLALDVREVGACYLGGTSLAELGAAGLVTALTPDALARTSAAFGWPVAPVAGWIF
ncbi:MAG: GNAT family N-acetyltransferase [Micropruina sp.]